MLINAAGAPDVVTSGEGYRNVREGVRDKVVMWICSGAQLGNFERGRKNVFEIGRMR